MKNILKQKFLMWYTCPCNQQIAWTFPYMEHIKMSNQTGSSSVLTQPQSADQVDKLKKLISAGVVYKQHITDIKDSLNEAVTLASKELSIDKKILNEAINVVFKQNYFDKAEQHDEVDAVLSMTGLIPTKKD